MVKKKDDKPVDDAKATKEPKAEKPASSPAAPADEAATPAGSDQSGRQLFDITCATCGKKSQVPFKPTGDRPVYCKDCYMKQRGGAGGGMGRGPGR